MIVKQTTQAAPDVESAISAVIDGILPASPAEFVRRPHVSAESPTLGLTHLQFEALLVAARQSSNPNDFALVAMLGLLGLRIFEATGADVTDLGEEHRHRALRVHGKGEKTVLVPLPPPVARAIDRAVAGRGLGRCCGVAPAPGWTGTPRPGVCSAPIAADPNRHGDIAIFYNWARGLLRCAPIDTSPRFLGQLPEQRWGSRRQQGDRPVSFGRPVGASDRRGVNR